MTPEGWHSVMLKDVSGGDEGLQTGPFGSQLHASDYAEDGIPVVMPKDLAGGRIITDTIARVPEEIASALQRHRVVSGDILFGRRGDIGRCGLVGDVEEGWLCGTGCLRARPNPRATVSAFLVQVIASARSINWLTENAVGQTMLNLNTSILGRLPLDLPPLGEQKKIAAILSSVDEAIEATQAVIEQLQVVKKAMMSELLTRGLPGRHTRFKPTEIGEVPAEWDVIPLADVIEKGPDNGLYKPQSDYGTGTPIVRIDAFENGDFVKADGLRRVRVSNDEVARFRLVENDILINRVNSLSHLAKTAIVVALPHDTIFESNMMRLAVDGRRAEAPFMFRCIASPRSKEFFLSRAKQAVAQASVNQQDVGALRVPLPPKCEQAEIARLFDCVDRRLRAEADNAAGLVATKAALMSALLTGQVRVKPDEPRT